MTLAEIFDVLTCSNIVCKDAPPWYDLSQNWAAHVGIGAFLAAVLPARWAWAFLAVLIVKEPSFDFARAPSLAVAGDSAMDIAAMMLGAWIAGTSQFTRPARINAFARLWPQK